MKLNRVYDDIVLSLPLFDPMVFYTDDTKYKVIVSSPFKNKGNFARYVTIGRNPNIGIKPDHNICYDILAELHMAEATELPTMSDLLPGVRRYLVSNIEN